MKINENEIVDSLLPLNGKFFHIPNLYEYARKLISTGKCVSIQEEIYLELKSYVLYYDNGPEIFISMVWTNPNYQGHGLATRLISQIIESANKNIVLEVHQDNPARHLYEKLKFITIEKKDDLLIMRHLKKIAIIQPYTFPYIGYFQLIEASNLIVFYDDVNYIKKGWINRNRILHNNEDLLFSVPILNASQNRLINETSPLIDRKWKDKFNKQLIHSYRKAPYFSDVIDKIISVFEIDYIDITDLAINSLLSVYDYLDLKINYKKSSVCSPGTKGMEKADRLIEITKAFSFEAYINPIGGVNLYDRKYFDSKGVNLYFARSEPIEYKQFDNEFVPWLSIIDILMFNDKKTVLEYFTKYTIE
jgi:WbqC-like protein family/Acetyltransferase (GNAT) family